jgi:DNA polymerase III subunit delta'
MSAAPRRKAAAPRSQSFDAEEAPPEADRLEGFAHPRFTPDLFGHGAAEQALLDGLKTAQLHHAWLITGPEGIGKATLAWRFARFALSNAGARADALAAADLAVPLDSPAVRPVLALSHPDLLLLRRAWNEKTKKHGQGIAVDEVRKLKDFVSHTGGVDQWRIVIIDRAEDMAPAAANAVLKTLEEPPKRTVFLIVAGEPGRLLPTIQSRCRRLDLSPLKPGDLAQAVAGPLAEAGHTDRAPEDAALYSGLAGGSVRRALTLTAGGGIELYGRLIKLLNTAPDLDAEQLYRFADELAPAAAEAKFAMAMGLLRDLIGRLVQQITRGRGALPGEADLFRRLARQPSLRAANAWSELWFQIEADRLQSQTLNLDRKSFLLMTFAGIAGAARAAG